MLSVIVASRVVVGIGVDVDVETEVKDGEGRIKVAGKAVMVGVESASGAQWVSKKAPRRKKTFIWEVWLGI